MRLAATAALVVLAACNPQAPDESAYVRAVQAARAAKDASFANDTTSPVPPDRRSAFLPLRYFPVDPAYSVPARFDEAPPRPRVLVEMPASSGTPRRMERTGTLRFTLDGRTLQLATFVEAGEAADRLFVPFTDATSGSETYAAGRYLEIPRSTTGVYVVDFNRAFNPYCYYNPTYDCPYPPKENRLPVAVRAGERARTGR